MAKRGLGAARRRWAKAGKAKPLVGITFKRSKSGRMRFLAIHGKDQTWSMSFASRQGARRAAKREYQGYRIAWGVRA